MEIIETPEQLGATALAVWTWTVEFLPKLGSALFVLVVGYIAATWAGRAVAGLVRRTARLDVTLHPVIHAVVRYGVLVLVLIAALGQLGIQTTSLLAALGAAGIAVALALQGTLSNIAAGIMVLWLRPFRAGDAIETPTVSGTVEEMGLFHTQIQTGDGIYKFVPNAQLWNVTLTNYTRNPTRLIQIDIPVEYEADLGSARSVLLETANAHPGVLEDPAPSVVPLAFGDTGVLLQLRAWARTADFWDVRWDLTESAKRDLDAAGIGIAYPRRVLSVVGPEAGAAMAAAPGSRRAAPATAGDEGD